MNSDQYESFNARNYSPEQVAQTFVFSEDYQNLWRNEHSVVLGPRGSGKTTLFKMLTVPAIYAWDSDFAKGLRKERPFTAIYVPTDMHWHHQLKHAETQLPNAPRLSQAISQAAVTTSMFLAATRSFKACLKFEGPNDDSTEAKVCGHLINQWRLPKTIPFLDLVVLGLKSRMADIRRILNKAIFENASDDTWGSLPDYFHLDYLAELNVACSAFDATCGIKASAKWALCFDELELAPFWLQDLAFSQQRSTEEAFLFKLSTSPIPKTLGQTEARPKQDFRLICMWNFAGREDRTFDERLTQSVIQRRLKTEVNAKTLFGTSDLVVEADNVDMGKYSRGSAEWRLFRELSRWDDSLRLLLQNAGVDPNDPVTTDVDVRDKLLRKAKPTAILRNAFLKHDHRGHLMRRSRKLGTIYYGLEAIYRVSDGNPRRLIGILGDMCDRASINKEGKVLPISQNDQADVLSRASLQFSAYVHALPGSIAALDGNRVDLTTLIRSIATYFSSRFFGVTFELDPVSSFKVDSNISDELAELLRLGVYHGAFVFVDPVPDTVETSLRGKRFRLSYMLSPLYKLPLRLYDYVALSRILRESNRLRIKRALPAMFMQPELPLKEQSQ